MNSIVKISFFLSVIFTLFASCELKREDYTQIYPENFYQNESDVKAAVTAVYNRFNISTASIYAHYRSGHNIFTEATTDIMDCDWADGGVWEMYKTHSWTPTTNDQISTLFGRYNFISEFRMIMMNIEKSPVSDVIKGQYISELKALRGWVLYLLYDCFGPVPIASDDDINDPVNSNIIPRPSKEDYFNVMLTEFRDAIANPYFPVKATEWGRVDKGVANMMLLKTLIMLGSWNEAEIVARELMKPEYGYRLNDDYYDCFDKAKDRFNPENIWSITCNNTTFKNFWVTHVIPGSYPYPNPKAEAWGGYRIPWAFFHTFESKDKRLELIVSEYVSKTGELCNEQYPGTDLVKGVLPLKYRVDMDQIGDAHGADVPIFRFSDAKLLLAEVIVRKGGSVTQEAMNQINDVRRRAGLNDLALADYTNINAFYDMILLERGHELFCEGQRRTDLIRFGKFIEYARLVPNSQTADYKVLFPIPTIRINEGRGVIIQNDGY